MYVLLYIQLHESKKEGGKNHGAKSIVTQDFGRASPQVEGPGRTGRNHHVRDSREACHGISQAEGGEMMASEKTKTPGISKVIGKKVKVKYQLMVNVQVSDPLSVTGWRWKLKGKRFETYQQALDEKIKIQAEVKCGKY